MMLEKYLGRLLIENEISRMKKKKLSRKKGENNVLSYKHMDEGLEMRKSVDA